MLQPHETLQDPERSRETSEQQSPEIAKLRDENMQLKIDLEVRKQLLSKAVEQSHQQGDKIEFLLRENGALGWRLLQLEPPAAPKTEQASAADHRETGESQAQRVPHTVVVENLGNRHEPTA